MFRPHFRVPIIGLVLWSQTLAWTFSALLAPVLLQARDYYVSPTGSDNASGTITQPFQTIQKAALVMSAGDTTYIRAGTYRETVTPKTSGTQSAPIRFMSYDGESVTVNGADVIPTTSWTVFSGSIYKAPMLWNLGDDANQVFVDGQMMIEAQWPNTTLDISHPTVAHAGEASYIDGGTGLSLGTISDPDLPSRAPGYWNDATLHFCPGPCWTWQSAKISGTLTSNQLNFQFEKQGPPLVPVANNSYFLTGKREELDTASEWFRDQGTSSLLLWTPWGDSPSQHLVEVKRRRLAFNLGGLSFVTIQGINLFASTVSSDAKSQHLVLDSLQGMYIGHDPLPIATNPYYAGYDAGIILKGKNNVLRNSTISFSSGSGVSLEGTGQRVINNVIRDTDYRSTYSSPVFGGIAQLQQSQHLIAFNTIYNSGRYGVNSASNFRPGRILHNEIYEYGLQSADLGCIAPGGDGLGTEIAYNVCHDNHSPLPYSIGIYLDGGTSNFIVHHNVVWNVNYGLQLTSDGPHKIYNNTLVGVSRAFNIGSTAPGTELKNNIFSPAISYTSQAVVSSNILPGTDPQFVDAANHDYRLKPTSPAINAGSVISPFTDGYSGSAPDIGAFDHAKPAWKAGVQARAFTVSGASYGPSLAPGSTAVVFGTVSFDENISIVVTDGIGNDLKAKLLYVVPSPPQLAFEIPPGTVPGIAMITLINGDNTVSLSSAPVFPVAPGLISADGRGQGIAAATILRVKADGAQTYESVSSFDPGQGRYVAIPIDLGSGTDQVFLVLYGTGIRGRSSLSEVTANVGGVNTQVLYAGSQNQFAGLDQVNLLLPRALAGQGNVTISLMVDGQPANSVSIAVK